MIDASPVPLHPDAEQRYQSDPMFAALVNQMTHYIQAGQFTPSELRDAVILAHTKYEMWHMPSPIFIHKMRKAFKFLEIDDDK